MSLAAVDLERYAGEHDAAIAAEIERQHRGRAARAQRVGLSRYEQRACETEAQLAEILPARIAPGETWDVVTNGDVDAMTYVRHAINAVGYLDRVLLSTWRVWRAELETIREWLEAGRVDEFTLVTHTKLETQIAESYEIARQLVDDYGVELKLVQNHSKVAIAINRAADYHLCVRGSANLNANPRIEQATLTNDAQLCAFYLEFFDGIRDGDRR